MARYHLYYLANGMLIGSDDIDANSDREAARIAEREGRGELVEIWNASSRVRILRAGGAQAQAAAADGADGIAAPSPAA